MNHNVIFYFQENTDVFIREVLSILRRIFSQYSVLGHGYSHRDSVLGLGYSLRDSEPGLGYSLRDSEPGLGYSLKDSVLGLGYSLRDSVLGLGYSLRYSVLGLGYSLALCVEPGHGVGGVVDDLQLALLVVVPVPANYKFLFKNLQN